MGHECGADSVSQWGGAHYTHAAHRRFSIRLQQLKSSKKKQQHINPEPSPRASGARLRDEDEIHPLERQQQIDDKGSRSIAGPAQDRRVRGRSQGVSADGEFVQSRGQDALVEASGWRAEQLGAGDAEGSEQRNSNGAQVCAEPGGVGLPSYSAVGMGGAMTGRSGKTSGAGPRREDNPPDERPRALCALAADQAKIPIRKSWFLARLQQQGGLRSTLISGWRALKR